MYRRSGRPPHLPTDPGWATWRVLPLALAVLVTLPVSYPVWLLREILMRRRYDTLESAVEDAAAAARVIADIRAGAARRATEWVLVEHSIASGAEEAPPLYVIELRDGTRRVLGAASGAGNEIGAAGVPTARREVHARGMAVVLGGLCWIVSLVVLAAALHGGAALWMIAAVLVVLLALLLAS